MNWEANTQILWREAKMYFQSKKDWWLGLIIWAGIFVPPVMLIKEGIYDQLFIWAPILLFVSWIWFGTGYTITEKVLKIKSGPIRLSIPLEQIKKIRKTKNPLSSPALSLDRLEIRYGKYKMALISPADKKGFVQAIKERNTEIEIDI
jgi:hypothetical protein